MKKNKIPNLIFTLVLTGFTAYVLLDTFTLSTAYQTDTTQMNTSMFSKSSSSDSSRASKKSSSDSENSSVENAESTVSNEASENENSSEQNEITTDSDADYSDENILINITEYYENDTKIYVADIQLSSAEYLKTAFAEDSYGKNITEKTSSIASSHNAILAINGDYYGAQERGYVIRNGIVYRDTADDNDVLCIYADGTMEVIDSSEKTADELVEDGVWQAFSFGPGLIENGEISVSQHEEVGKAMASNPRTAIGLIDSNHFVFVVADGRTSESEGLSLYELAEFMQNLGVQTAYNLDGGGSSTMYFNGEVINNPTTNGKSIKEREVSDIVYIG